MTNLQQRVVSAIVLATVVLALTWLGGIWFRVLAVAIGAAMLYEWLTMARAVSARANAMVAATGLGLVGLLVLAGYPAGVTLLALAAAVAVVAGHTAIGGNRQWPAAGLAYAGLSAVSLAFLRGSDIAGLIAVLFLFAVVWATDISAYFVGRALGGPKLAPSISPGKTQSGALGGLAGGVVSGLLLAVAAGSSGLVWLAVVAAILSIVAQAGDLFESWVKRRHGVKDSSMLIPGHGGVMDRVDGLVAAAVALYLLGAPGGGLDMPAHGLF